jgi:hypothetical protein
MAYEQDKQDARDQANHLFQHGLHEHNTFIQMGNYFLVAESLFVVAYAGLLSSGQSSVTTGVQPTNTILVARVLAFFGLLLTAVWIYVNRRQREIFRHLQERARELVPEYKVTYETRPKRRISAEMLIAYFVPIPIGIMWTVFLFIP